jgi:hypothetical protein
LMRAQVDLGSLLLDAAMSLTGVAPTKITATAVRARLNGIFIFE